MSDPPPAAAEAASRASGARRRARAWALLKRTPKLVDPEEVPAGTNYAVDLAAPPRLSTLLLSRALIPAAAGDDGAHVECADGEGNLLLSLCSGPAQGGRAILLYLPRSGAELVMLPEVPRNLGVDLRVGRDACIGITASPGPGLAFAVAQLHRRTSSSASAAHRALVFSSSTYSWAATDVKVERRFEAQAHSDEEGYLAVDEEAAGDMNTFQAHTAVSNDGRFQIVFVDLMNRIILLFSPGAPTARFLHFPGSGDGLPEADVDTAAAHRVVACSEGSLFAVEVSSDRQWITMARLREDDDAWVPLFKVSALEVFGSDPRMVEFAAAGLELGPVDPTNSKRIVLYVPGAGLGFMAELDGTALSLRLVHTDDAASRASCTQAVVWKLHDPDAAGWIREVARETARMGAAAFKAYRENAHNLPPLACVAGGVLATFGGAANVAAAAAVVGGAGGLATFNNALGAREELSAYIKRCSSSGEKLHITVIRNEDEALKVIVEWKLLGRPTNMQVKSAPGLTQEEVDFLRKFIRKNDADALLPDDFSSYVMVSKAINF